MASSKPRLSVLVADTNEVLRNNIRTILEELGHSVTVVDNGARAKTLVNETAYDLVVSNTKLNELDGVQLLSYTKAQQSSSRFVVISEDAEVLRNLKIYQMGADECLPIPFNTDDFLAALDNSLTGEIRRPKLTLEEDFIPVPIEEFITGSVLKVDVHLKLGSKKFIKMGIRGGRINLDQLQKYMLKGIGSLHLRKEDFAEYVGFNITLSTAAHNERKIETARKLRLTKHTTENLMAQLREAGIEREQLENACSVVLNTMELVTENPSTLKLLEQMELSGCLPSHCVAVSVWACLIAKELNWAGQSTYFKIAMSALFHDIGLKEMDENLYLKRRFELSTDENRLLESHTRRGRDILGSVPNLPEDVAIVAAQHHELYHGGGYPHGLKLEQIHPIAKLISIADRLCEVMRTTSDTSDALSLVTAFDTMAANHRDFDPNYLRALAKIIQKIRPKAVG